MLMNYPSLQSKFLTVFYMAEPFLPAPKNWQKITLEADREADFIVKVESGGTPSTTVEEYWDGDVPWLTPKEITGFTDAIYVSRTERNITQDGLHGSAAKLMPIGTVMLTKRAPVGAVAINAIPMATNQGFLNFVCGSKLRPLYLAYWFRANRPYLDAVANGSTYPELYKGDLFEFEIAVPPIEIQDKILNVISSLQFVSLLGGALEQSATNPADVVLIQEQDLKLLSIRDALIIELLSGKITPSLPLKQ